MLSATSFIFEGPPGNGSWNKVQVLKIALHLKAGNNTILCANSAAYGADSDRLVVS